MTLLFFKSSHRAWNQVTEIFDFLWPTATAMWNLRWQVAGYVSVRPNATKEEIEGRFTTGSEITGANLQRACIDHTWEYQQEQFAGFLLTNLFAIYESWARDILRELGIANAETLANDLQHPTGKHPGSPRGVQVRIDAVTIPESQAIKTAFYAALSQHKKNSLPLIENLLICYRYFKACRNCQIHNGGIADALATQCYTDFLAIATTAQLGTTVVPDHKPIIQGQPIVVTLSGVVTFCDILLRLITTLDAELARSISAENAFVARWRDRFPSRVMLPSSNNSKRDLRIRAMLRVLQFPPPSTTTSLVPILQNGSLIW